MKSWVKWGIKGAIAFPLFDAVMLPVGGFCGVFCLLPFGSLCERTLQSPLCSTETVLYYRFSLIVGSGAAFWLRLLVIDVIIGFAIGVLLAVIINAAKRKKT
jgi:hypothetical protein